MAESLESSKNSSNSAENTTNPADSSSKTEFIKEITEDLLEAVGNAVDAIEESRQTRPSNTIITKEILDTILEGTEHNIQMKEHYENRYKLHNQYKLFRMADHISDFDISDIMYDKLCFRESLIIEKIDTKITPKGEFIYIKNPVGGLCLDVQKAEGEQPKARLLEQYEEKLLQTLDEDEGIDHIGGANDFGEPKPSEDSLRTQNKSGYSKFLVHVSSQFDVEGSNGGSANTSWVDRNLHTIEELRREFLVHNDSYNEKTLFTAIKKNYYYLKHTASVGAIDDRKLYSMRKIRDYISEGANFVLMRYLAVTRFFGEFELSCCYINGDLCRNIYICCGPESRIINDHKIDCCRIRRTIIEECGLEHKSITVLSLSGLILNHEWEDCDYILTVNPHRKITDSKPVCLDEISMNDNWEQDMQLFSAYLDKKDQCMLEMMSFDVDHPELRQLLADYVNQILLMRPSNIRGFTRKYFGNFVSTKLPRNNYFE